MAERDRFMEGFRGTGWDKYTPEYQNGERWQKVLTFAPSPTVPTPVCLPAPPKSISTSPVGPGVLLDRQSRGSSTSKALDVDFSDFGCYAPSYHVSATSTSIFEADWWLVPGRLGSLVDVGETLKESLQARVLSSLVFGGLAALTTYDHQNLAVVIILCALAAAFGALVPFIIGWTIENAFTAAGHLLAYAAIAVAGALAVGAVAGVCFLIIGALGHKAPTTVKAATTYQVPARPVHFHRKRPNATGMYLQPFLDGTAPQATLKIGRRRSPLLQTKYEIEHISGNCPDPG